MTSTELTIHEPQGGQVVRFDDQQRTIIRKLYAPGVSELEFAAFLQICERQGLDPFARQIYAIPRSGRMTIQVSIDGLRLIAAETGEYRGQVGPEWCGEDGLWRDVWFGDKPPSAARVGVLREGFDAPTYGVATWKSFGQANSQTWKGMPDVMLAKCAEAQALRKAFPQRLMGLFAPEEERGMEYVDSNESANRRPAIAQPQRKSQAAPKPRSQPEEKPFGSEDDEPVDAEFTEAAAPTEGGTPWGVFYNEWQDKYPLVPISEVAAALELTKPTVPEFKAWYTANGADLSLIEYVADQVAAKKGGE